MMKNGLDPLLNQAVGAAQVLIVDDDVDSANLVESIFSRLGCETTCIFSSLDAKEQICAVKADIIILDWMLDHRLEAGRLVNQCARLFDKLGDHGERGSKPKIITYSSLNQIDMDLPENPFFEYFDNWKKPLDQRELLAKAKNLLKMLEPREALWTPLK